MKIRILIKNACVAVLVSLFCVGLKWILLYYYPEENLNFIVPLSGITLGIWMILQSTIESEKCT